MSKGTSGVYIILCTVNGRRYVGSSNNIQRRWREHRNDLRRGEHHSAPLQADWNEHGEPAFSFTVARVVPDGAERFAAEQELLDAFEAATCGYNIAPFTYCLIGTKRTPEQVANLRASWTPERRRKVGDTQRGSRNRFSKLTDEAAREIRQRLAAGERGVTLAAEFGVSQAAISAIRLGRVRRDEFDPAQIVDHHGINTPKLTERQVREIREHIACGLPNVTVAALFGVSGATVSLIRNRRIWSHVT